MKTINFLPILLVLAFVITSNGCSGGSSNSATPPSEPPPSETVLSEVLLDADGTSTNNAYTLIESAFGSGSIEAPDLFPADKNHTGFQHIQEDRDAEVGNHFVFYIHKDLDWDRGEYPGTQDRQRNEIKTFDRSAETLKARKGQTFVYQWKFKIAGDMPVTSNFTHLFQLKAVDGDDSHPLITISGSTRNGGEIQIRYKKTSYSDSSLEYIDQNNWWNNRGHWLTVFCQATFDDNGKLYMTVKKGAETVLTYNNSNIDLWREDNSFIRPKWGIYRSLADKGSLTNAEDTVRFANFSVKRIQP